jgi:hypothetical protein
VETDTPGGLWICLSVTEVNVTVGTRGVWCHREKECLKLVHYV